MTRNVDRHVRGQALSKCLALSLAGVLCSVQGIPMQLVAQLPEPLRGDFTSGDSDHDSMNEVFGVTSYASGSRVFCYEHCGGNQYERHELGFASIVGVWGIGDGDGDSLLELTAQLNSRDIRIVESPDRNSLPTESIWQRDIGDGHYGYPRFIDLDIDGKREMAFKTFTRGIRLYECAGDNRYDSAAVLADDPPFGGYGHYDVMDFDRDGLPELVAGDFAGTSVFLFEGTA